ncbi:Heme response regulator HssR [compost metagenome]
MCARPGQVYSRDQLIDQVWGVGKFVTERTVDAHVSHLRKKIADSSVKIETVLSAGYKAVVSKSSEIYFLRAKDSFANAESRC